MTKPITNKYLLTRIQANNIILRNGEDAINPLTNIPGYKTPQNEQDYASKMYNQVQQTSKRTLDASKVGQGGLF